MDIVDLVIIKFIDAIPWLFSGLGIFVAAEILAGAKKISSSSRKNTQNISKNGFQPKLAKKIEEIREEPYSVVLGKRHKLLRENYLQLSKPEMRDFYNYDKVAELEKYESGEDEFPHQSIEKLQQFFFVNKRFIDEGDSPIFRSFDVCSDEIKKLLVDKFQPYFLCFPDQRERPAYIVFYKEQDNFARIIRSRHQVSFSSNGGGSLIYELIIFEMLRQRMSWHDALILKVNKSIWKNLEQGTFYSNNMYFGLGRAHKCADIFYERFQNIEDQQFSSVNWTEITNQLYS